MFTKSSRPRIGSGLAPAMVLLVLTPVVAEVLFGATPISNPGALLPDVAVYGCGALLIREVVRRRGLGWPSILALGVAFGIVEEDLALGSLFNPDLFNAGDLGGRALGVNWVWTLWTLGYHAVWSISIPILLAELLCSARRDEAWLGRVGLWITGAIYVLGVLALAVIFHFAVTPGFATPAVPFAGAALLAVCVVVLALRRPADSAATARREPVRNVPSPWLAGLLAFVGAGAWFVPLLDRPGVFRAGILAWMLLLWDAAVAAVVMIPLRRWSGPQRRWTDSHRLALILGALPASMLYGFSYVTAGRPVDRAGQALASVAAMALLGLFAHGVSGRVASENTDVPGIPKPEGGGRWDA